MSPLAFCLFDMDSAHTVEGRGGWRQRRMEAEEDGGRGGWRQRRMEAAGMRRNTDKCIGVGNTASMHK